MKNLAHSSGFIRGKKNGHRFVQVPKVITIYQTPEIHHHHEAALHGQRITLFAGVGELANMMILFRVVNLELLCIRTVHKNS